jgi:hypothetical protein
VALDEPVLVVRSDEGGHAGPKFVKAHPGSGPDALLLERSDEALGAAVAGWLTDERGLRPKVKVIVGGVPVTRAWAAEIGADGYSEDAVGAVALARSLVGA